MNNFFSNSNHFFLIDCDDISLAIGVFCKEGSAYIIVLLIAYMLYRIDNPNCSTASATIIDVTMS